jgi:iron(III) transport system ATP-binding protein
VREVTISGLSKAFGSHPVLADVDLRVPAGSFTAVLGPSGSGKTTMLRVLAGFDRADAGLIRIGDRTVDGGGTYVPPERRQIGYVPQEGALFPHLTVAANVGFGLRPKDRRGPAAAELLESVGLAGLGHRYPHQLSGGQQQRVALARALAVRPEVVLLDEPFAALDSHLRASVRADVQQICRRAGTTAILVTHDQDEALSMADRIAVLRDGRIVQYAPPQELYTRPADPDLARFVGDANLVDGQVTDGAIDTVLGRLPIEPAEPAATQGTQATRAALATGDPVTVLIRPEQLSIAEPGQLTAGQLTAGQTPPGGLPGRVVACEYYGHDTIVQVQPDADPAGPRLTVRTAGGAQLAPGHAVIVRAHGSVRVWPRS